MNNSLSQFGTQLQAIWKQLGFNQRVSLALAAAVVLVGLGGLGLWSGRADYALLYGKLDDAEAARVLAALDDAKVPYKVSRGSGTISVPADKVLVMRMQLAAKGIPRGDGRGYELLDGPNFGISDFLQRANYLRAMQGEMARTISAFDSIESARVMIVVPENRLLVDSQKRTTASVFVRVRGNSALPVQTVNAIRFFVANAVEGLVVNNVNVVDNQGTVLSDNSENDATAGLTTTQLTAKKNLEQYLAKKAEDMLNKVLGPGQSVVRVSADINFDSLSKEETKIDPESQVLRTSIITDENVDSSTATANGGVPGATKSDSAETNATAVAAAPTNSNKTRKKVTNIQNDFSQTVSKIMQTPGGLKRLSAAILVAANVAGTGTNRVVTSRTPEEMKKIQHIVRSALGIQEGADAVRQDQIAVEEMPFNEQFPIETAQQLDKQQKQQFWWELAKNGVYPVLALGVLFFFWRTLKQTPADNIPLGIPVGKMAGAGNGAVAFESNRPEPGAVTVDVLNQLIRENPNNMTQAIRSWMTAGKGK